MVRYVKGEVVTISWPFSDGNGEKVRPAFVVTQLRGSDYILCAITTKQREDGYSIELSNNDFVSGNLPRDECVVKPNRLFTASGEKILFSRGLLSPQKTEEIIRKLVSIITN